MIKLIRELRNKTKKFTYKDIISPNLYNKIEDNYKTLKFEDMLRILSRLDTGLDELLFLTDELNSSISSRKIDFIRQYKYKRTIKTTDIEKYYNLFGEKDKFYYLILYLQAKSLNDNKNKEKYSEIIWKKLVVLMNI